jgi:hypothetical protein
MKEPHEISENPEKPNMTYVVKQILQDADIKQYITWLVLSWKHKIMEWKWNEQLFIVKQYINVVLFMQQ